MTIGVSSAKDVGVLHKCGNNRSGGGGPKRPANVSDGKFLEALMYLYNSVKGNKSELVNCCTLVDRSVRQPGFRRGAYSTNVDSLERMQLSSADVRNIYSRLRTTNYPVRLHSPHIWFV